LVAFPFSRRIVRLVNEIVTCKMDNILQYIPQRKPMVAKGV
jgi:hypothetical protein